MPRPRAHRPACLFIPLVLLLASAVPSAHAQTAGDLPADPDADPDADRKAVHAAVADYVDALYEAAPERIERSVHPDLVKLGFYRDRDGVYQASPMTYEQLHDLSARWNLDNHRGLTDETPREIILLDVLDKTASAKLVADWGIDYLHLAKNDGEWQIVHVLWQSHP